jgi:hypothetical protein
MRSKDVRSGDVRRLEQGMKIGNEIPCGARHGDGRAPAQMIRIEKRSRPVIGANPRELGNLRKNAAHSRLKFGAPNVSIISVTRLKNHRRAARAIALEIHLAPIANVDEIGKISGRGDWSVTPRYVFWRRLLRFLLRADAERRGQSQRYGFNRNDQTSDGILISLIVHNEERNIRCEARISNENKSTFTN